MGPIKAVATTNRRRRISILTPSLIRTNLHSIQDGTEGINGIPFQPSSTQAPPATAPPSAAFKGIKIVAPAAAKPSATLAIRAHCGRGCCHRMSFTRSLYLKDSPSSGDVFVYQLSPEAATTQDYAVVRRGLDQIVEWDRRARPNILPGTRNVPVLIYPAFSRGLRASLQILCACQATACHDAMKGDMGETGPRWNPST